LQSFTVIAISPSARVVTIQRDKVTLLNGANSDEPDALVFQAGGFAGHVEGRQRYSYECDPNGFTTKATLRKDGGYGMIGSSRSNVRFGVRGEHYDYNF